MSYIAAIDIGSNAIRLAIATLKHDNLHISYRTREAVRLGSSVFSEGSINESIYEDLKTALLQFKNQMENHNVKAYRAVATSAMREAQNNMSVLQRLKDETGILVEMITGEEEAKLVQEAIAEKLNLKSGKQLLIDIGGGSIELIAMIDGEMRKKESFVLGMVRVLELHKSQNKDLKKWLPDFIREEIGDYFDDLPAFDIAVGTGGNMDRFLKLRDFVTTDQRENLSLKEMKLLYQKLTEVSYEERIVKFALKPDRADVIIPAAIATIEMMKLGRAPAIHLPQVGLKDGILQELSSIAID